MASQLNNGDQLNAGDSLTSPSGDFQLFMQGDGNFVLYTYGATIPIWASNTSGNGGAYAKMQSDGNLVVYNSADHALWSSQTNGKGGSSTYAVVQDDGNFVVYASPGGRPLWATGTNYYWGSPATAYWWQNWLKSFAYSPGVINFPTSLAELVQMVQSSTYVKVVGNGWSMSDAALPFQTPEEVNAASVISKATKVQNHFDGTFLQNFSQGQAATLDLDIAPLELSSLIGLAMTYDQQAETQVLTGPLLDLAEGRLSAADFLDANLNSRVEPALVSDLQPLLQPTTSSIIDIRLLASCLQSNLPNIAAAAAIAGGFIPGMGPNAPPPVPPSPIPQQTQIKPVIPGGNTPASGLLQPTISASAAAIAGEFNPGTSPKNSQETQAKPVIPGGDTADSSLLQPTISASAAAAAEYTPLGDYTRAPKGGTGLPLDRNIGNLGASGDTILPPGPRYYFHVEAGITMQDLGTLLDHQSPRMGVRGTAGSSGGTLGGILSTATHGAEFTWPLLIDTVKAIHLVGPTGTEWWIEGTDPVADPAKLMEAYPGLSAEHIIAGGWRSGGIDNMTAQDVLKAVTVSMGAIGVIYSVVLEVLPQYGLRQLVVKSSWNQVLAAANQGYEGDIETGLRNGDPAANQAILDFMLDGTLNGTTITKADNVYAQLDMNPLNFDAWIENRQVCPVPVNPNLSSSSLFTYPTAVINALTSLSTNSIAGNHGLGALFDYFGYATDLSDLCDDQFTGWEVTTISDFINSFPDAASAALAVLSAQSQADQGVGTPKRLEILAAMLSAILDVVQGTVGVPRFDSTFVSNPGGNAGWPASGIAGTAIEIAVAPEKAFSFLQATLIDGFFTPLQQNQQPFLGYISIRICPATQTLMGMQQFKPYSVMFEVVAFRSPSASALLQNIESQVILQNGNSNVQYENKPLGAMLHWAFLNDQLYDVDLLMTPLGDQIGNSHTKVLRFRNVRRLIAGVPELGLPNINSSDPSASTCFDNNFTRRLGFDLDTWGDPQ